MAFSQSVILGDQVVSLFLWWAGKDCDDIDTQKITLKSLLNQPHAKELDFFHTHARSLCVIQKAKHN